MNVIASPDTDLAAAARRVLPAGGFGNFAPEVIIREGKGGRVWDVSGKEYIDYLLGSGPMFLGHGHPEVIEAVQAQIPKGCTFFANNEHGIRLAEVLTEALPCAERVRFVSTGSEADMYAMRVARAFRKRDRILKFEGGYHGMSDWGLMSLAPKRLANFPVAVPDSAGIPKSIQEEVLVAPFNDLETAKAMIAAHHDELGGVIVEPFQRLIPPAPGFLQGLREITAQYGIPLIFDEVVTGFRFCYGGAQSYYGVTPDLCTLGKIVGGGFALAAIAGRADIMAHFDRGLVGDDGFLMQVGTLSGNPVAAVAGLKTLEILKRPGAYDGVLAYGRKMMAELAGLLKQRGVPGQVLGEPTLFDVVFSAEELRDYRAVMRADANIAKAVNASLRESGILKGDSKYYLSTAHDARDCDQTLSAFAKALASLPAR
ncbi:aminotransferase class III-fold pyridoxal phosphate-dependent enzyme [Siccirubricoccus sp. KC 17139]|uniref:Aminotransferase class III-fold pyridoxal phosphate-dependent enzyme n=1 Tax=Siccirubricoccus soli TaxID=2899147 RepID=A0ABT1CZA4_9PROT|nr:aminotransferase class III-fold pyridoxal phosphate-dependent enzyme [Siccirubricoccus soli]MCO6414993.1 aminotransferase class III-fold pyridoxal phosphate-dependent enzyme [Siccirubricoccus soli]MCP2681124.1 aminotransferase class III-fold pyridoxal phosphate-dependent enzyme [Siccirubricoccus soli]